MLKCCWVRPDVLEGTWVRRMWAVVWRMRFRSVGEKVVKVGERRARAAFSAGGMRLAIWAMSLLRW